MDSLPPERHGPCTAAPAQPDTSGSRSRRNASRWATTDVIAKAVAEGFHNLGVGMDRRDPHIGREAVTKEPKDRGRFKTPTLRNVALTWPYMHDGSEKMLGDVVEFYDRGGVPNPNLDVFIVPLELTDEEQKDLVAFLEALTGPLPKTVRPAPPK